MRSLTVLQALLFYPRGGSAQVVSYLAQALAAAGHRPRLVVGTLGGPGERSHAPSFFGATPSVDIETVDYTASSDAFAAGADHFAVDVPMHPSYEHRPAVPDLVFSDVSPHIGDRLQAAWAGAFGRSVQALEPDVAHLHHLTPMNAALREVRPRLAQVAHLHGTDLKFLAAVRAGRLPAEHAAHADYWAQLMVAAARSVDAVVCISPHDRDLAQDLLGVDADRVTVVPNGVDTRRFSPRDISDEERIAGWRRWLVDDPRGWDETGVVGSVRPDAESFEKWFVPGRPVLMYVGRFLDFKRVPTLVRAYARARDAGVIAPLVIWGGSPGEWEGEHPVAVAREVGDDGIFFAGWRGHDELPDALASADALVAPSVNEPFGQVYLEAMACGRPVVGTTTGGPLSFVNVRPGEPDGWLVAPDSVDALAKAIHELVDNPEERRRRGRAARAHVVASYSWDGLVDRFMGIYDEACARRAERV